MAGAASSSLSTYMADNTVFFFLLTIQSTSCVLLVYFIVLCDRHDACCARDRVCDEIRLSVEFVTVRFLGICRQYCCD